EADQARAGRVARQHNSGTAVHSRQPTFPDLEFGGVRGAEYPTTLRSDTDRHDLESIPVKVRQHAARGDTRDGVLAATATEHYRDPSLACIHGNTAYRLTAVHECTVSRAWRCRTGLATTRTRPRWQPAARRGCLRRSRARSRCEWVPRRSVEPTRPDVIPRYGPRRR